MASREEEDLQRDMLQGVKQMSAATQALRTLIEREYPTRRELEARFVEKVESRRVLIVAVVVGLVSAFLSFLGTVTTISTCFLSNQSAEDHPAICELMPGYEKSLQQNEEILKEFQRIQKFVNEQEQKKKDSGR